MTTSVGLSTGHAERQERESRALLELLREMGIPTANRSYGPGDTVYGEGEPGDALYVLTGGVAKLSKSYSGGKEAILRLLGPWDAFGDLVFGGETSQHARAEAFTACEVTKIPKVFLEGAIRRRPEVAVGVMTLLELELAQRGRWAECLLPFRAEARLANLLWLLLRKFGGGAGSTIGLRLTHEEIAGMVVCTRESVTQALTKLRR